MIHLLHVLVLFELVDQFEHFGRLLLGQLDRSLADVLVFGRNRRDATLFECPLQRAEVLERAARDQLRLVFLARALAEFLEAVVDQVQLEIILVDTLGAQAKHAHAFELERDAARGGEIAAVLAEGVAHARDGPGRIVGRALDQHRDAMRGVAFVQHLLEVGCVASRGALDGSLDLVLGHVDRAGVLDDSPQRRVRVRVGATTLDRNRDVLADSRELLGHAVPTREHRVLADFENSTHGNSTFLEGRAIYLSARRGPIYSHRHSNNWQNEPAEMTDMSSTIVNIL